MNHLTQKDFDQFIESPSSIRDTFLFNKINELILELDELKSKSCKCECNGKGHVKGVSKPSGRATKKR